MHVLINGILVAALLASLTANADAAKSVIGNPVANFTLKDYRGKSHSLDDFKDRKLIVLAFLGTECPLAKLYSPRLVELAAEFDDRGVAFVGINANRQDSITEIAAHARVHKISFPILKDLGNRVADEVGAVRTPEVFVLDEKRNIRYHGRIDDQYLVGLIRDEPKRRDLQIALTELLAGKNVTRAETKSLGCYIGRVRTAKPDGKVTYSKQIARIFQKRCVECHRPGEIAPFSLTEYEEVVGWAETIDEVVETRRMPPWHANPKHGSFANDRNLSDEEKKLIHQWVADGAPEGDRRQLPKPIQYVTGWNLGKKPDTVVYMRNEPYTVKAEGEVKYQYFTVDPKFKKDKWVKAAEILPGNRSVVHHVLVFCRPPHGSGTETQGAFLAAYVPGMRTRPLPDGMAKHIPAGSRLIFQVHYTPIGSEQQDRSKLGLVFVDEQDVEQVVFTSETRQLITDPDSPTSRNKLTIPSHAENHREVARTPATPVEAQVLGFLPHMHLRGKSFRYLAHYPDGRDEILLDVPRYDFNWQTSYRLTEPKTLPVGTEIHCVAHYDNSENNLANPDPSQTVRWGDQTWDEMLIGYVDVAVPRVYFKTAPAASKGDDLKKRRAQLARIMRSLRKLDKNRNGKLERSEVPRQYSKLFDQLDVNKDNVLSDDDIRKAIEQQQKKKQKESNND